MKKKIMSVILSAVLVSSVGIPTSVYGEDFISGETAEEAAAEADWAEADGAEVNGMSTDEVTDNENSGTSWEDAGDIQAADGSFGFGDGETEDVSPQAGILTDGNAEDDVIADATEEGAVDIDSFDAATSWFDKAAGISVNTTYAANFTENSNEKYYKVTVPNNGTLSVDFSHAYLESDWTYWKMEIYNGGNHEDLAYYEFAGNQISYSQERFGVAAGTYYVKIYKGLFSDITFNFRFNFEATNSWETELNDTYQAADELNVNELYYGSLQRRHDVDWYRFTTPQDGCISLEFTHDYIENSSAFWQMDIYNASYSRIETYGFQGSRLKSSGYQIGLPAGTYYLKLSKDDVYYSNLEYGLKVNYEASNVWEREFNDNYATATPISLSTTYYGSIQGSRSDADWFTFMAPGAGNYKFSFAHDYLEDSGRYWDVEIYNSLFEEKTSLYYSGNDKTDSDKVELGAAGTYYIKITGHDYNSSSITYAFSLTSHIHNYTSQITKATLTKDGTITRKCSCGYVGEKTIIYRPNSTSLSVNSYTYDGKSHKPGITIYDSKGNVISANNYTLSYGSNTKSIGTHYITIRFKDNYSGTASRNYTIYPKSTKLTKLSGKSKGFSVKWNKVTSSSGYQIQYSTSRNFKKSGTVTISKKSTKSATVRRLKGKKKYYVRVRTYKTVSGYKYYSSWSNVKSVKTKK